MTDSCLVKVSTRLVVDASAREVDACLVRGRVGALDEDVRTEERELMLLDPTVEDEYIVAAEDRDDDAGR